MNCFGRALYIASIVFFSTSITAAQANTQNSKDIAMSEAAALCESAAKAKYGDNSIKSISDKVKWSKGLKGATVKMKIKQKSKKARKYSCVVNLDKTVGFHRV